MTSALATKLDQLQTQLAHSEANRETWKFVHEGTVNVLKNNGQKTGTMGGGLSLNFNNCLLEKAFSITWFDLGVDSSKYEQLEKSYKQLQNE